MIFQKNSSLSLLLYALYPLKKTLHQRAYFKPSCHPTNLHLLQGMNNASPHHLFFCEILIWHKLVALPWLSKRQRAWTSGRTLEEGNKYYKENIMKSWSLNAVLSKDNKWHEWMKSNLVNCWHCQEFKKILIWK